jgi:hypothetical protein
VLQRLPGNLAGRHRRCSHVVVVDVLCAVHLGQDTPIRLQGPRAAWPYVAPVAIAPAPAPERVQQVLRRNVPGASFECTSGAAVAVHGLDCLSCKGTRGQPCLRTRVSWFDAAGRGALVCRQPASSAGSSATAPGGESDVCLCRRWKLCTASTRNQNATALNSVQRRDPTRAMVPSLSQVPSAQNHEVTSIAIFRATVVRLHEYECRAKPMSPRRQKRGHCKLTRLERMMESAPRAGQGIFWT